MHSRLLSALALSALALFARPADAKLKVLTTTTDLADLTRAVAGDKVDVQSLSKGWQDPHFVEAKPSLMLQVHQANLVIAVGLELEIGWLPGVLTGARNPDIMPGTSGYFEASDAISPIEVKSVADRTQGDVHPRGNPHYWTDPLNAKLVASAIAERLTRLDPPNGEAYAAGAKAFGAKIDERMTRWQAKLSPVKGAQVVTYHRTLNYFFQRFGLVGFDYVEPKPGIPPSPAHIADLITRMRAQKVKLILVESFYDPRVAQLVAAQSGATLKIVPVSVDATPEAKDYFALIDTLVNAAAGAGK